MNKVQQMQLEKDTDELIALCDGDLVKASNEALGAATRSVIEHNLNMLNRLHRGEKRTSSNHWSAAHYLMRCKHYIESKMTIKEHAQITLTKPGTAREIKIQDKRLPSKEAMRIQNAS